MKLSGDIENQIIEAAEKVFFIKGKDGASMQDIADEASITRTSLNYYFRTKDKLFEAVFRKTMLIFVPRLAEAFDTRLSFYEYLHKLTDIAINTLSKNPQIPVFVLQELSSNPGRMPKIVQEMGIQPEKAFSAFRRSADESSLLFDPVHVIINVISMCIFPFAAKPMVKALMFKNDEDAYYAAMKERKEIIKKMIDIMYKINE